MLVENVKLAILDACACKNTKEKYKLKIKHFYGRLLLPEHWQVFTLDAE